MQLFGDSLSLVIPHFSIDEKDEKKFRKELKDITPEYRNIISEYLKS
jgi:hypothetical protein